MCNSKLPPTSVLSLKTSFAVVEHLANEYKDTFPSVYLFERHTCIEQCLYIQIYSIILFPISMSLNVFLFFLLNSTNVPHIFILSKFCTLNFTNTSILTKNMQMTLGLGSFQISLILRVFFSIRIQEILLNIFSTRTKHFESR